MKNNLKFTQKSPDNPLLFAEQNQSFKIYYRENLWSD